MEVMPEELINQKGFLKTRQFFSTAIIQKLNSHLRTILARNIELHTRISMKGSFDVLDDFDKIIQDKAVTKLILDRTLMEASQDEYFKQVSQSSEIKSLFQQVTGGNLEFLHFHVKPNLCSDSSRVIPWHQDQFYTTSEHSDYSLFSSLWMPLTDIGSTGGGLIVVENSHFNGSVDHKQYKDTGMFTILPPDTGFQGKYLHLTCQKGDGIVLNPKTIHCSAINTSGKNRWAVVYFLYGNSKKVCS